MTTKNHIRAGKAGTQDLFRLPDPPQPKDMNNYRYFNIHGNGLHLIQHFGNPETTIVYGDTYLVRRDEDRGRQYLQPDLLIAFNANPANVGSQNGYVIEDQGTPSEFVLEIASDSTVADGRTWKR